MKKVLVAVSGGIDSVATTLLLKEYGYDVTGINFIFNKESEITSENLSSRLGIKVIQVDLRRQFQNTVISYFIDGYIKGWTPAPCSLCNPAIKWKYLKEYADKIGIKFISTGHYVNVTKHKDKYYICKAKDPIKDQSYYLWGLQQDILSRAITPLGNFTKSEIRDLMHSNGLEYFNNKKESMGICFLYGKNYMELIRNNVPTDHLNNGKITNKDGKVIGHHYGYPFYTIGQKRGLELFDKKENFYITDIIPSDNKLICGKKDELYQNTLFVSDITTADINILLKSANISVKIRGVGINPQGYCKISSEDKQLKVITAEPAYAPAKGQPVVFYMEDIVVGGGILENYTQHILCTKDD